ncbi:MAG: rhomboid family intramembrane serine protease [Firmicutes bacterium]|nr:rhomboid family intramembrane serine protease [Bacillota bacterium]
MKAWLNRLERKYGRYAIKNLMFYLVIANAVVYVFRYFGGNLQLYNSLMLVPQLVLRGQIWRLLTFIAIPPSDSLIFIFFALYFYYLIGSNLEREWGSVKFNLFYLCGMVGTILASFITGHPATAYYLNLSLFLAFAHLYPDFQLMIYFILPVKIKYLGYLAWIYLGLVILTGAFALKLFASIPILTFLIFFGRDLQRNLQLKRQVRQNRKHFLSEVRKAQKNNEYKH